MDLQSLELFIENQKQERVCYPNLRDAPSNIRELYNREVAPFGDLLKQENLKQLADDLKFSAHAQSRILSRGVNLSPADRARLTEGVNQLAGKGAKESLILLDDLALIVSVANRTVVTVLENRGAGGDGIFTNIDSAMLIEKNKQTE